MRYIFDFTYLSAIWLQFGQNPIGFNVEKVFELDFPELYNQTADDRGAKLKNVSHFSKEIILFIL